jgi:hypothetical protein
MLKKILYRSDMMVYGSPKCTHTHSKNILAVALVVILFLWVVRITNLENQSITMNTQSFPCLVEGRPNMYSIYMDSQGLSRVGRGMYSPCFLMVVLEMEWAV